MSIKITTGLARLSYAHLFTAHTNFEGQEPKFSAQIIIPKSDTKTLKAINDALAQLLSEAYPNNKKIPANYHTPLKDGDLLEGRPEVVGCYFLNASAKDRPGVVDADVQPILDKSEVYSGCFCRFNISLYAYNTSVNKGLGCGLNHVQKIKDGPSLEGKGSADQAFSDGYKLGTDEEAGF